MSEPSNFRDALKPILEFRIGRVYCPGCGQVAAVVREIEVEIVTCPTCHAVCISSHGQDDTID